MPQSRRKPYRLRLPRMRSQWRPQRARMLFTRPIAAPMHVLATRIGIVVGLGSLAFLVLYLDRDGLRDVTGKPLGLVDLLYFTLQTVATVGYGDIVPVTTRARLTDALLLMPVRIVIWFVFLGTAYQFVIQRVSEEYRMKRLHEKLSGHVVVCGFGVSGAVAVRELLEGGFDANQIVVMDRQESALEQAASLGVTGLLGDPSRDDLLQQARVRDAKAVIISVPDDSMAILMTLSVRSLAPKTRIIVRIQEQTYHRQMRQAGADVIVSSSKIGGLLLADAVESSHIVPFVNDLLSTRGRVELVERTALPHEVGCWSNTVGGVIVISLTRGTDTMSFYEDPPTQLEAGDMLLVIQSQRARDGMEEP